MAQHQHALVRYVALDRCLSRLRLTKDELIARCSEAVSRVTGDDRRISEKTFYNDIRALREGIVLGREAPIVCTEGLYQYDEHGFSLFHAGTQDKEMKALQERLEALEIRAWLVLERIEAHGVDKRLVAEVRAILSDGGTSSWAYIADKEEEAERKVQRAKDAALQKMIKEEEAAREKVERSRPAPSGSHGGGTIMFQLAPRVPAPPESLTADELARWFLDGISARGYHFPKVGWLRQKLFRWKVRRVARSVLK